MSEAPPASCDSLDLWSCSLAAAASCSCSVLTVLQKLQQVQSEGGKTHREGLVPLCSPQLGLDALTTPVHAPGQTLGANQLLPADWKKLLPLPCFRSVPRLSICCPWCPAGSVPPLQDPEREWSNASALTSLKPYKRIQKCFPTTLALQQEHEVAVRDSWMQRKREPQRLNRTGKWRRVVIYSKFC